MNRSKFLIYWYLIFAPSIKRFFNHILQLATIKSQDSSKAMLTMKSILTRTNPAQKLAPTIKIPKTMAALKILCALNRTLMKQVRDAKEQFTTAITLMMTSPFAP